MRRVQVGTKPKQSTPPPPVAPQGADAYTFADAPEPEVAPAQVARAAGVAETELRLLEEWLRGDPGTPAPNDPRLNQIPTAGAKAGGPAPAPGRRFGQAAPTFGRVTGIGGVIDTALVVVALLFVQWLLGSAWKFGADYTLHLMAQLWVDLRAAVVPIAWGFTLNVGYVLPLALSAYQWKFAPYLIDPKRKGGVLGIHRNREVAGWALAIWWGCFILDIGSSFGGVWAYLNGRSLTLFAQTITLSASGWGTALLITLSLAGSILCAFAPESVGRPAMAELYNTLRARIYQWARLDPKATTFWPRRLK